MNSSLRESDIRPADLEQRVLAAQRREIEEQFLDPAGGQLRADRTVRVGCLCGRKAACQVAFSKHGFDFVSCAECGLLFVDPRPIRQALETFYGQSESERLKLEILECTFSVRQDRIFAPRAEWIVTALRPSGGRLLDVGCGNGIFLELFLRRSGWEVVGVDLSSAAVGRCREKGIHAVQATIEAFDDADGFDVVTLWEVLEHVFDPLAVLRRCRDLMRPGGALVLTTPNIGGFDYLVLGSDSSNILAPVHLNYFDLRSLTLMLERAGFRRIEVTTPGKLDVDIVRNYWQAGGTRGRHPLLERLVLGVPETAEAFQAFLAAHGLSGSLQAVTRD